MPLTIDQKIGHNLRKRRKLLGLTQIQVGEAIGVRFQQIHKYESGAQKMSASRLWDISRFFGIDVQSFYDGIEETACEPRGADSRHWTRVRGL